jgi:uncharacterized protein DUF707
MPGCRNLLIAPYGNSANVLTDNWLKYKDDKQFDVCLVFYHQEVTDPEKYNIVEYFFHLKGFKFRMIHDVLVNLHPEWMDKYDYFYFIDDDVQIDTHQINRMFDLAKAHDIWIAQASLTKDSFCSWPILKTNDSCFCRYMGQIEVMAPLFSKYALEKCLEAGTFITNNSSWGIDCAWPHILGYPQTKLVVFDVITMKHIHPVGKGELYKKIGDPHGDWDAVVKKYGTKKHNYQEYGRLLKVNSSVNVLQFGRYKFVERMKQMKKDYNDYPLSARIKNKLNKIKGVMQKPPVV